ncbi:geranylgeranyl diphosphate synthase [mine drainage metagenome]|uniref:Geranylgeranyl diphosphate synthase n=1 Tax=mine drainage metagenome TaxID=410659 RepID=A0A1J5SYD6_9ZZZZ
MDFLSIRQRLSQALIDLAPRDRSGDPGLNAAILRATSNPGGLVRAALAYESSLERGLGETEAEAIACGIEYFHLASLILDDLPCMDDASTRRGRPCLHREHGEGAAILVSLTLISRAYTLLGAATAGLPERDRLACQTLIDQALGARGLAGGQAADLSHSAGIRNARDTARIALRKTGGLFILALLLPAIAGGATSRERSALRAIAVYWSLAYQALDDARDLVSSDAASGKSTGRDRLLGRPNLALVLGLPAARLRALRLAGLAERRIAGLAASGLGWSFLAEFQRVRFRPSGAGAQAA